MSSRKKNIGAIVALNKTTRARFPGAADELSAVRLPSLPQGVQVYDPPVSNAVPAPPIPQLGTNDQFEAYTTEFAPVTWIREVTVYKTKQPWRACDVYINIPGNGAIASQITIFVYALSGRTRTLVGSGRLFFDPTFAQGIFPQDQETDKWICAVRSGAQQFEVTMSETHTIGSPNPVPGPYKVTVVGSNDVNDPPPNVGQVVNKMVGGGAILSLFPLGQICPPRLEVLGVQGVNTAAAARYLCLYDCLSNSAVGLALETPVRVWPLGATAGAGFSDPDVRYRTMLRPVLAISSHPTVYAAVADGAIGWTLR